MYAADAVVHSIHGWMVTSISMVVVVIVVVSVAMVTGYAMYRGALCRASSSPFRIDLSRNCPSPWLTISLRRGGVFTSFAAVVWPFFVSSNPLPIIGFVVCIGALAV